MKVPKYKPHPSKTPDQVLVEILRVASGPGELRKELVPHQNPPNPPLTHQISQITSSSKSIVTTLDSLAILHSHKAICQFRPLINFNPPDTAPPSLCGRKLHGLPQKYTDARYIFKTYTVKVMSTPAKFKPVRLYSSIIIFPKRAMTQKSFNKHTPKLKIHQKNR